MKTSYNIFLLIIFIIIVSSCSDDSSGNLDTGTNPSEKEESSIPLVTGNVWNYKSYYYDKDESIEINYSSTNKIGNKLNYKGRESFKFISYDTFNGVIITHISKDDEGVYLYYKKIKDVASPLDNVEPGWIKIVDFKMDNWESYDEEFIVREYNYDVKANIKINGSNLDSESVTYNGKTYVAKKYQLVTEIIQVRLKDNRKLLDEITKIDYLIIDGVGVYSEFVTIDDGSGTPIIESFILN